MQVPACAPHQLQERHSAAVSYFHVVPAGLGLDDALNSTYWRNAWKLLERKALSTIDLICDDNTWEAKVRIMSVADGVVKFRVLSKWEAPKRSAKLDLPKDYRVEHITGKGWRAVAPDGTLAGGYEPQEADAVKSAIDHAQARTKAKA